MSATVEIVPLAKIKPQKDFNPRAEFDDAQMGELVESVKQHGIISPLTLAPDGAGGFVIIAGERRYRAAKAAKLRAVPAQVRDGDAAGLTLAVAENVIRADLTPSEEARAYRRLVEEHGDRAEGARMVGKSENLIAERIDLLRLPDEAQRLTAARWVPPACAPCLIEMAEREPVLAEMTAAWLAERPHGAAGFPGEPGDVVDDVLAADWTADDGAPLNAVAYSVGGYHGPILPRERARDDLFAAVAGKLGQHAEAVESAYRALPEIERSGEYDWQAREREQQRERECFALDEQDGDAARAFGCLLELPARDSRRPPAYVTDAAWLADRLTQKIAAHVATHKERRERKRDERRAAPGDDPEREARREQRQRDYEARVSARARNLDLGAAVARWEPKL